MKKNWIEKIGEGVRRRKFEKEKQNKIYWELPADERLHYDSKIKDIKNSGHPGLLYSYLILKISLYLPLFLIVLGYFTGNFNKFLNIGGIIFISIFKTLPYIVLFEIIIATISNFQIILLIKSLDKQFKIIK